MRFAVRRTRRRSSIRMSSDCSNREFRKTWCCAVLQGSAAQRRLSSTAPEFIVSAPKSAQLNNYLTLASFAIRDNQTREVLTGGGYLSYSSGIHPDRIIPIVSEQMADQSRATDGFILYQVRPERALA